MEAIRTTSNHYVKRISYYWLSRSATYGFPVAFYAAKLGFTKESTTIVMPLIIMAFLGVIRIAIDVPTWVSTWQPSFAKGMVRALPVLLLFVTLVTLGLTFKYMVDNQVEISFIPYFETIFVLFGSASVGSILFAVHLKNKELDLMSKGYVLGTLNKKRGD